MRVTAPSIRRVAVLLSMAVVVTSHAVAAPERGEVKDRQGNVIRVLDAEGHRDLAGRPAPPIEPRVVVLPDVPPALRDGTAAPGTLTPVGGSDTWPMFQANARHTGFLRIDLDPADFALRWQQDIGGNFRANPVAAGDGKVYVSLGIRFDNVTSVFALDATDGHTVWSRNLGPVNSVNPPSLAYGTVYVQTGKAVQGIQPYLHAFDGGTGAVVFQAPFAAQWESYFAPTIHDEKVYVNGGYYGGMYAFDAFNGAQLWFADLPQYDQWTPAVDDTRAYAYVGEYQPGLYVRDRATGGAAGFIADLNFDWNGWSMNIAPVLGDHDDVISTHDGRLVSFDIATNTIRYELAGQYTGQPSLAGDRIYVARAGQLAVLDEVTGGPLWSWPAPDGPIVGPMIVTRTHVLVSTAGWVHAVDLATHQGVWSYPAGGHLAMADDTLYVASSDGMIRAFEAPAGRLQPAALAVDAVAGPSTDGNGVLEPGETVSVAPSWLNGSLTAETFTGAVTTFSGPGTPGMYTIVDAWASYGTVASGAVASCTATADCYALGVGVPAVRPATHWDAGFDEEIAPSQLAVTQLWTVHVGASFADVPRSSVFYRFVETLLHWNVTGGCSATTYCPSAPTMREQMAVFVLLAKEGSGYVPSACAVQMFSDVPVTSPYCRWIQELARRGVAGGCGANLYCPTAAVSRQDMAVFVLATKEPGTTPPACGAPVFSDVPPSSPFCPWVEELARRGVVTGCGGGAYCPTAAVTREQMGVFLSVTFGLQLYGP